VRPAPGFVIAIDGPAGAGKSTTARLAASELGFRHLDTGAMYRAVTLKIIESGTNPRDTRALSRLLAQTRVRVEWPRTRGGTGRVLLDGREVGRLIRTPTVNESVSVVAAIPLVRRAMVKEQRRAASRQRVVCEGRDIGSVVFPRAQLKVYLDCDIEERTRRRERELRGLGTRQTRTAVRAGLALRDQIDSTRTTSPLRQVKDAVVIDTTDLTIAEQVGVVCDLARRRGVSA